LIQVYKYQLAKSDFGAMPREERALIFLAGQTLNVVSTWIKLIRLSSQHEPVWEAEQKISGGQTHILLRALFGALHEAWSWQTRPDMGPLIARKYLPQLDEDAQAARKAVSRRLGGGGGIIGKLRNGYAFHNPSTDALDEAFDAMPESEDWSWYVTEELTTSFYLSCELVVGYGIAALPGASDLNAGFKEILREVIEIANAMNHYVTALLAVVLASNIPVKPEGIPVRAIDNAPNIVEAALPFYVEGI
jgi:hypothetical protein